MVKKSYGWLLLAAGLALCLPGTVAQCAEEAPALRSLGEVEAPALRSLGEAGLDVVWVLLGAFLVFFMQAGFGMVEAGFIRAKNVCNILTKNFMDYCAASIMFFLVGYAFMFGEGNGFIGWSGFGMSEAPNPSGVPTWAFWLFQAAFCGAGATIVAGAMAERMKFSAYLMYTVFISSLVYPIIGHWVWGGGWLATQLGTLDFAGGIVVHTTAGVSALVVAVLLGRRQGFPRTLMLPHSPSLTMAGAALLWMGWFGFNGGSALAANDDAASAIINTHVAASAAAMVWLLIERLTVGKPTSVGFATGAIAGLATVTPAAGFISPGAAMLLGAAGASVCYPMIQLVKHRLLIDDSLDVFAVHGVGGILGSILLAVFLSTDLGGTGYAEGQTMAGQLAAQVIGVGIVAIWSAVVSTILALAVSVVLPMRVSEDEEREGLDITSHGERGWEFD